MIFRIEVKHRHNAGIVQSIHVSLLLNLPNHSSALQHIALIASSDSPDAHLGVCTVDRLLLTRDLELGPNTATVRRSHKYVGRSTRWVGLCAHRCRPSFFAASADRRILEIDASG